MTCPRCGNEWDVSKSPCSRCGLLVRLPARMRSAARMGTPPQKEATQSGGMPAVKQQAEGPAYSVSSGMAIPTVLSAPTAMPKPKLPPQPQLASSAPVSLDPSASNLPRSPQSFRPPNRSVTDPLNQAGQRLQVPQSQSASFTVSPARGNDQQIDLRSSMREVQHLQSLSFTVSPARGNDQQIDLRPLMPGTQVRNGRYHLHEMLGRQEWSSAVGEVRWLAYDAQRSGASVMICELVIPDSESMMMQSMLRSATMALTSVGRNPHVPTLWDAFSDQGRNFFVFELIEGESLLDRMRRTGWTLSEQEVIECCLQMTEVLELLAQQSPPLIHGQIRPEHIVAHSGSQYVLTNFSIVLAGGAMQLVSGVDRSHLSPYAAPEFVRGVIDVRSDLYSLLATAYYLITGSVPTRMNATILSAQRLNPNVSPQFGAILAKGLSSSPDQRYQRPAELRQELLSMHSADGSPVASSPSLTYEGHSEQPMSKVTWAPSQPVPDLAAQLLPHILASATGAMQEQERKRLLPRPEELPLMSASNDWQMAVFWLVGILVCLIAIVVWSRGFF